MFGYLVAELKGLSEEQLKRYKACYCGLCRSLEHRHGQLSRLTINYDVTFLVLLLSSLYEPEERQKEGKCIRHPCQAQSYVSGEICDYAADMNLALACLKCQDNWNDDRSIVALAEWKYLKRSYESLRRSWPRQCQAMERSMEKLREIEENKQEEPDQAAACFGELMAELFVYREDRWSDALRSMAHALGRFIYLMDACMDLDSDVARNRYNPLRRYHGLPDNEQRFRDILKMQLGECVFWFDKLPLVSDAELMKNIICAGLWQQFDEKFSKTGKGSN